MDNDDNVTNTEETTANQTTVATETGNGTNDQGSPEVSQNGQDGGNTEEAGEQHYTLDEILKADPAIKAEYDRKMQAAIAKHDARLARGNSNGVQQEVGSGADEYQQQDNEEEIDLNELVDARVEERMTEERFAGCLDNLLDQAGIVDKQGYLSHIDIDDLYEHYDPETNSIPGYEDLEAEMRDEFPFYFGTESGGMEHGTFGSNAPATLRGALSEKYGA